MNASIQEALSAVHGLSGFHRDSIKRVAAATGWGDDLVALAGGRALADPQRQRDDIEAHVGQMLVAAQRARDVAVADVAAFIRWLTVTDMRAATAPWQVHAGPPAVAAYFLSRYERPRLTDSLCYLCPTAPVLRVGRELPVNWCSFAYDTVVDAQGIRIEMPWKSVLEWKQLHPCTEKIANAIVLQHGWHGAFDVDCFLRDAGFRMQSAVVPV